MLARAQAIAATTGGEVSVTGDPEAAVAEADAVATDTWISMGQEAGDRVTSLRPYAVTPPLVASAAADAIVLHCLPAYRGQEIAAEVIDGPQAVVWDEAENRRHVQKAVLVLLAEWNHPSTGSGRGS